ncbi:MAG TPA: ABC transporter ATP-binding protein [Jatrophihabitantaceae bacterium]|jgi:ABC-type branched-subunit amino acid transport system ATPase component|nr:ABC transporter ATP-binding protein [Jatrophihabitantaceae bacterium]
MAAGSDPGEDLTPTTGSVLSTRTVSMHFGGVVALHDVTVNVPPSTTVGLIGPNGAGKSTLLAVLSGLLTPTRGAVVRGTQDISRRSARWRARSGIARTFQHPELFADLTVTEHLQLAYRIHNEPVRLWTDLWTGNGLLRRAEAGTETVQRLLDLLNLNGVRDRLPSGLSLGTCRIVELARALASDPRILLLDEPASGLDIQERARLADVLQAVAADGQRSLLLVEHDVDMVMDLCDLVYVLNFGELIASGTPDAIRSDPAVLEAYLGKAHHPGAA